MTERFDLSAVNHALREISRLQLAGELDPETAWRERRDILLGVEGEWDALAVLERPPAETPPEVTHDGDDASASRPMAAAAQAPGQRLRALPAQVWHWLLRRSWRMPLWIMLLVLALLTFSYVGSL